MGALELDECVFGLVFLVWDFGPFYHFLGII